MRSFKRRAVHATRTSYKYSFTIDAHSISGLASPAQGLPDGARASLQVARGTKLVSTDLAPIALGRTAWDKPLEFICTLYASKKSDRAFSEKPFHVSLLLTSDRHKKPLEVASADVDVATFAADQMTERRVNFTLALHASRSGKASKAGALASDDGVELTATIASTYLKDMAVDPDEESLSSVRPGDVAKSHRTSSEMLEQDLRGFDDDGSGSESSLPSSRASHSAAAEPPDALARQFAAQAAALASATAQLIELKEELTEARSAATAAAAMPRAHVISRSPPPPLHSKSMGRSVVLEAETGKLKEELAAAQKRESEARVACEAAQAQRAHGVEQLQRVAEEAKEREARMGEALSAAERRAAEAEEATTMAVSQVEAQKQRIQAELLQLSSEQGDITIRLNMQLEATAKAKQAAEKAEQAAETAAGKAAAAQRRVAKAEAEAAKAKAKATKALGELDTVRAEQEALKVEALARQPSGAPSLMEATASSLMEATAAAVKDAAEARAALAQVEQELADAQTGEQAIQAEHEEQLDSVKAAAAEERAAWRQSEARVIELEERVGLLQQHYDLLKAEAAAGRARGAGDGAGLSTDDDESGDEMLDTDDEEARRDAQPSLARKQGARPSSPGGGASTAQVVAGMAAGTAAGTAAGAAAGTAEEAAILLAARGEVKAAVATAAAVTAAAEEREASLEKTRAQADFLETELRNTRSQLAAALAAAEASAAEARVATAASAAATAAAQAAEDIDAEDTSAHDAPTSSLVAAPADATPEAALNGRQQASDAQRMAAEAAAAASAQEAAEFRMELVECKIRAAEVEFEKEQYRGRVNHLAKQLKRLGGDSLAHAERTTNMEVRLARSLQEAAKLREENEALQSDVKDMITLKLKLTELQADQAGDE